MLLLQHLLLLKIFTVRIRLLLLETAIIAHQLIGLSVPCLQSLGLSIGVSSRITCLMTQSLIHVPHAAAS